MKQTFMKILGLSILMSAFMGFTTFATETAAVAETAQAVEEIKPVVVEKIRLDAALIEGDMVHITGNLGSEKNTEDNQVYLFELQPYEDSLGERRDYIATAPKAGHLDFRVPLLENTENTRLFSKFVAAVYAQGKYHVVSNPIHVTNPEVIAPSKLPYQDPLTKKGLLIELNQISDAFELGVKHVIVNINFSQVLGEGIEYEYEGKTYHFSAGVIAGYDKTISTMSGKSMLVTAVVLNGWNPNTPELVYPGVKKNAAAHYYGFNTSTKEGYETTRALASFLAQRYSGENHNYGRVSNWVIGNEINNNLNWNYMGDMSLEPYVKEFERSFRVIYTAMKSKSANARLFYSIDYDWNFAHANNNKYSAKHVVDKFNAYINDGGNIDWNLAYHPYPVPLTEPEFWDDEATGMILQNEATQIINFANLHVLTDYLKGSHFRNRAGQVRRVILSEQGFTSRSATRGDNNELQAAAFAYAYYIADANPFIDAFILSRQVDAVVEVKDSLAFGLWSVDMNSPDVVIPLQRKKIWAVFKNIDNRRWSLEQTEFAKKIIGIEKWSDVIENFRYKSLEK